MATCSAFPRCLLAGRASLCPLEEADGAVPWQEGGAESGHPPRARHPLQPNQPFTQTCTRAPKDTRKTCSGAKAHSVLAARHKPHGLKPKVRAAPQQRVRGFKRCRARSSAWLSQAGHRRQAWGKCLSLWYQGKARLSSRASCAVVWQRSGCVAKDCVEDLRNTTLDHKENIVSLAF